MDLEMINAFLDNHKTYQNLEKHMFISKLQKAFEKFYELGDSFLTAVEGNCTVCDKTRTGFTFIGDLSRNYMSIIFIVKEDRVADLFECSSFKNKQSGLKLNERIMLHWPSADYRTIPPPEYQ